MKLIEEIIAKRRIIKSRRLSSMNARHDNRSPSDSFAPSRAATCCLDPHHLLCYRGYISLSLSLFPHSGSFTTLGVLNALEADRESLIDLEHCGQPESWP